VVAERQGTSLPSYQMYPSRSAIDIIAAPSIQTEMLLDTGK
jgi:hypothetical protein